MTFTERTAPKGPNSCHSVRSSVSGGRLYTNSVQPCEVGEMGAGGGAARLVFIVFSGIVPGIVGSVGFVSAAAAVIDCVIV